MQSKHSVQGLVSEMLAFTTDDILNDSQVETAMAHSVSGTYRTYSPFIPDDMAH